MQKQSHFNQHSFILCDPKIGPYHKHLLRARVDLGTMAMKGYSAFPKAPTLLELHNRIV